MTSLATGWDPWSAVDAGVDTRAALAKLKPEEREVLTLVAWEDLTVADAVPALGLPTGTAPGPAITPRNNILDSGEAADVKVAATSPAATA